MQKNKSYTYTRLSGSYKDTQQTLQAYIYHTHHPINAYHRMSSQIIAYHRISSHIIAYHRTSSHIIAYHRISLHIIAHRVSSCIIAYRSSHIIAYHRILNLTGTRSIPIRSYRSTIQIHQIALYHITSQCHLSNITGGSIHEASSA